DTLQNDIEDTLNPVMMLLSRAITKCYSTPTNNRLRSSLNIRNQAVMQADIVHIQSRNVGNEGRIAKRSYNTQEESTKSRNVQKETGNCPNLRVRDSKYFREQMLPAKKDEDGVILSNEQNDFLIADAAQMEEIEELSVNICMMARIRPVNISSDEGPSYDSAFISETLGRIQENLLDSVLLLHYLFSLPERLKADNPTTCPNRVKKDIYKAMSMSANKHSPMEDQEECFVEIKGRKKKGKARSNQHRQISGIKLSKPNPNFQYRPVSKIGKDRGDASNLGAKGYNKGSTSQSSSAKTSVVEDLNLKNSFEALKDSNNIVEA
ncbi:hypothetical protein Tco_0998534, partial [Tanacetum coccineum]